MGDPGFRYLNLANKWPGFTFVGLEVSGDGSVALAQVPNVSGVVGEPLPSIEGLTGPAGIAVDCDGNVYISDEANQRIVRMDGCTGESAPLACFGGEGSEPGRLNTPRGLAIGARKILYVTDAGNNRIQLVDLDRIQLVGVWGQPDPYTAPTPSDAPGRFDEPWDVAVDTDGAVYVVDYGNRRIQKLSRGGMADPDFWDKMHAQTVAPQRPGYVAIAVFDDKERVLVLDMEPPQLLAFRTDGTEDAELPSLWTLDPLVQPAGLATGNGILYVADAAAGRVLSFAADGSFLGFARGFTGPVAGLAFDCHGRLLVHPGGGAAVSLLQPSAAYATSGAFLAGPIRVADGPTKWQRLRTLGPHLAAGAHVRLFTLTAADTYAVGSGADGRPALIAGADQLAPPWTATSADEDIAATAIGAWRVAPADARDLLVLNEPASDLWIAGLFAGDGTVTPTIDQVRVEFDHDSWTRHLPAVYRRNGDGRVFLERTLALLESSLVAEDDLYADLPRLLDPGGAPADVAPDSWLDWLAGWLAFELRSDWTDDRRREALAVAFELEGRRGTVQGLIDLLELYTGVHAQIVEPALTARLWRLGESSSLGFETMLVPAAAEGAVLGTTAILDASELTPPEDFGAPLFDDVAHRFCVRIYSAEVTGPDGPEAVRAVVDHEKPAHTAYHLCLIRPRLLVGYQATIGVDAIVGQTESPLILDETERLGLDTALQVSERGVIDEARVGQVSVT